MTYLYQQIETDDLESYKSLMKLFGEVFDEPENYIDKSPSDAYIHKMLSKETFIAITAMYNKEVVGGLAAYVLDKFEQDRREIYIYDLAVSEKHRRKHIATNLIHLLREIAIEKRCICNICTSRLCR